MQEAQNPVNFRGRALPIGRGEREECKRVNTETRRGADDAAGGLGSRTMAGGPREISRNSPAAVAVGNDGDMEALIRATRER